MFNCGIFFGVHRLAAEKELDDLCTGRLPKPRAATMKSAYVGRIFWACMKGNNRLTSCGSRKSPREEKSELGEHAYDIRCVGTPLRIKRAFLSFDRVLRDRWGSEEGYSCTLQLTLTQRM